MHHGGAEMRTFMLSVVCAGTGVGLWLFDEPSALLDSIAEHGEWLV